MTLLGTIANGLVPNEISGPIRSISALRARIQAVPQMNSDVQKLIELQQVDARMAALRAEVAALPKEVAQIEAKLAGSKTAVEKAQNAIKADETARRKHESDIKDQQEKISKYRDQSLKVKTNQEYKALMSEIEHAEAEIRSQKTRSWRSWLRRTRGKKH